MKSTTIENHKHTKKNWMASHLIPDVEHKHVEIDALIPIDLHADLRKLFHKT